MYPPDGRVHPNIDLDGEPGFVRVWYADETFLDITLRQFHNADYPDAGNEDAAIKYLYDPVRENWVRVEDTKGWYAGIGDVLHGDREECPF